MWNRARQGNQKRVWVSCWEITNLFTVDKGKGREEGRELLRMRYVYFYRMLRRRLSRHWRVFEDEHPKNCSVADPEDCHYFAGSSSKILLLLDPILALLQIESRSAHNPMRMCIVHVSTIHFITFKLRDLRLLL